MEKLPLPPDFKDFLQLLHSEQVEYLLVGGYAVAHYGYPRATGDLDIWIAASESNAEKVATVLQKFGFSAASVTAEMFNKPDQIVRMGVPPICIDVITSASGVEFARMLCTANSPGDGWCRSGNHSSRRLETKQKGQRQIKGLKRLGKSALTEMSASLTQQSSRTRQQPQLSTCQTGGDREKVGALRRSHRTNSRKPSSKWSKRASALGPEPPGLRRSKITAPQTTGESAWPSSVRTPIRREKDRRKQKLKSKPLRRLQTFHRHVPPRGRRLRLRPARRHAPRRRPRRRHLHPRRQNRRRRQRRHRLRAARIQARPHGQAGRPHHRRRRAGHQPLRRRLLRAGRHGHGADRRQDLRQADLRRRPRRQGRAARRQSRHRDGPLPVAHPRRRRRDRRSARPARPAGRRHDVDHPRVQPAGRVCRGCRSPKRASRPSKFDESIGRGRRDLTESDDHHDRPGRRPRLRRCDLARTHRQRPLAAGRAHRRRVALRAAEDAARPRSARPGHERLPARPRDPDAAGDHLQQPGQPAAGQSALRPHGDDGVDGRRRPRRDRCVQERDQEPAPVHLRRSRRILGGKKNDAAKAAHSARKRAIRRAFSRTDAGS